jgi:hypothetical protein
MAAISWYISKEIGEHLERCIALSSYDMMRLVRDWVAPAFDIDDEHHEFEEMTEQEAVDYVQRLVEAEIVTGRLYDAGNWQSYVANVQSKGLISLNEYYASRQAVEFAAKSVKGGIVCWTEFKVDEAGLNVGPK